MTRQISYNAVYDASDDVKVIKICLRVAGATNFVDDSFVAEFVDEFVTCGGSRLSRLDIAIAIAIA